MIQPRLAVSRRRKGDCRFVFRNTGIFVLVLRDPFPYLVVGERVICSSHLYPLLLDRSEYYFPNLCCSPPSSPFDKNIFKNIYIYYIRNFDKIKFSSKNDNYTRYRVLVRKREFLAIVKYKNSVDERTEGYLFPFFIRPAVIRRLKQGCQNERRRKRRRRSEKGGTGVV